MAREFVWRRRRCDIVDLYDGYQNDPVNAEWSAYWVKACELVQGETLTRTIVNADYYRAAGPADSSSVLYHSPVIVGVYVGGDANSPPTINPWVHQGYQDWLWWEAKAGREQRPSPWSDDLYQTVSFDFDTNAQRKAKNYPTPHSVVWYMWATRNGLPFTQPSYVLRQVAIQCGVLLP